MKRFVELGGLWVLGQVVVFSLYGGSLLVDDLFDDDLFTSIPWWTHALLGGLLGLGGLGFIAFAMLTLGANLTPFPAPTAENTLVRSGPFRVVRHPIYGGIVVTLLGAGLAMGRLAPLLVALLTLAFLAAKSKHEERLLERRHPSYGDYREEVRWRVLPFIV